MKGRTTTAKRYNVSRQLLKQLPCEGAMELIQDFERNTHVFTMTKGQIALLDIIEALVYKINKPCKIQACTYAIGVMDCKRLAELRFQGLVSDVKIFLDYRQQNLKVENLLEMREALGDGSFYGIRNHMKMVLLEGDGWFVSVRSSANLMSNPRYEQHDISDSKDLYDFINNEFIEICKTTKAGLTATGAKDVQINFSKALGKQMEIGDINSGIDW